MRKIAILILFSSFLVSCGDELSSKKEWSILQAEEAKYRGQKMPDVIIENIAGYRIAGVPSAKKNSQIWILLNSKWSPYYKQLPDDQYNLSEEQLNRIIDEGKPSETVLECLHSHLLN